MREIKFRAWDKEDEVMIDWFWLSSEGYLYETPATVYDTPHLELERNDDLIAMQYTGLKDAKGVEIYEGDIINYERRGKEQVGIVEYYASACSFLLSDTHLLLSAGAFVPYFVGEVIGNIYENPELLEE